MFLDFLPKDLPVLICRKRHRLVTRRRNDPDYQPHDAPQPQRDEGQDQVQDMVYGLTVSNDRVVITLRFDSPTVGRLSFQVSIDGKQLYNKSITLGEDRQIDLDVNGALQLKLIVTYADQDPNYFYGTRGDAQLADGG